ncbi:hypothetical protein MMC22_004879 [Lobaria immixta]|nr:hypothetical protein [Lobaria immixta]
MPGLDYTIESLGAQGLSTASQLNRISDTYVGIWNLENTSSSVPVSVEYRPSKSPRSSSGIGGTDERQLVADADVAPGGKYRSIVKLFLRYASQEPNDPWITATGWLIAPDLIVTAGHSAFDWFYKMGRLTQVKAYVGYNGRASAEDPTSSVQFRQGNQVATTAEWLRSKGVRAYNLAFIKVHQPFTGIVPVKFQDTPRTGRSSLGVVGYAGDIADQSTGEKGARMYESFSNTRWNLEDSEYRSSGSPVLRKEDMVSIGTHVYGGNPSSASVIGLLGSPYEDYVAAFAVEPRRSQKQADGIKYVHISVTGSAQQTSKNPNSVPNAYLPSNPNGSQTDQVSSGTDQASSGPAQAPNGTAIGVDVEFFEILRAGIRLSDPVLDNILQVHLPMVLGSVGSPVGALAGAILSTAGKLATQSSSPVNDFRQGLPYDGILERAILGEAAFSAVMSMKRRKLEEIGVFLEMAKVVKQIAPATKEIAPFIMHTLTAPALRIALDALHKKADGPSAESSLGISSGTSFTQQIASSNGTLDPNAEKFFQRLSARCASFCGSEASSGNVDRILHIGFREAGPVLTTAAYEGLQLLATILPDNPAGGEGIPAHHPFIDGLPERAMLGEAALQALMKVPMQGLDESAFEIMAQSVARIGHVVIQSAHGLIEDIGFAVKGILAIQVANTNGISEKSNFSVSSASRREKGFSYVNLEREVLDYYRGLEEQL